MDETAEPFVIPGWIWIFAAMFALGVIVTLVIKRDRGSGHRHRHGRRHRHRSHRHRHRSDRGSSS